LIEEEAQVMPGSSRGLATRLVIVASIALAFGLAGLRQSFAGCGGYCEARQALAICHHAVKAQGLNVRERDAEFEKCKGDPASYLQLEELADELELSDE
jgi:hypothetical protein